MSLVTRYRLLWAALLAALLGLAYWKKSWSYHSVCFNNSARCPNPMKEEGSP